MLWGPLHITPSFRDCCVSITDTCVPEARYYHDYLQHSTGGLLCAQDRQDTTSADSREELGIMRRRCDTRAVAQASTGNVHVDSTIWHQKGDGQGSPHRELSWSGTGARKDVRGR